MTISEFLVKAKVSTYASVGASGEKTLKDGSKELLYQEDEWKYRDRYLGSDSFTGEEIVWRNENVVWAMNYDGGITIDGVSAKEVYKFLKKALRQVKKDRPFRGPLSLVENSWAYSNKSKGTVDNFEGCERILYQKKLVYELKYHGGAVRK